MPTLFDHEKFRAYLFEIESALSMTAQRDCEGLRAETQLSAAIYALLRATSMFRAALMLLETGLMDGCDVVRRACWEAWILGYEFRLVGSGSHAARWHLEKQKHSEANLKLIKAFETAHGMTPTAYGTDYGGLTEVSHPTKSAAENSLVTVTALHGNHQSRQFLDRARETIAHEDAPGLMYLLIWVVLVESPELISLRVLEDTIPAAAFFYRRYEDQDQGSSD
jgi:hypothetical protein